MTQKVVPPPDGVFLLDHDDGGPRAVPIHGDRAEGPGGALGWRADGDALAVTLSTDGQPISRVALRWARWPVSGLVLGDAWERGYGDLQWQTIRPDRLLPWYWLTHEPATGLTSGMGVRVRAHAFCGFTVDGTGVTLWLDVRNGSLPLSGVVREIPVATVVSVLGSGSPFAVTRELCRAMCPDPVPLAGPLVGVNDWYYAYGEGTSADTTLRDARVIADFAGDSPVRPFAVVDGGWSEGGPCPGGPYTHGVPGRFDDMPGLAAQLRAAGSRPGIWIRPTATIDDPTSRRVRPGPRPVAEVALDLSLDENIESVARDVETVVGWGYELIKHDFSTFDVFGRFGFWMGSSMTDPGWRHADGSLTNAELILRLYETIAAHAGDAVVIGCNTVGHLAAGLVHAQRSGDDTSGRSWETTRRMGVNSLAFRLPQHGIFFATDADCVACTPETPWEKNRQFLDVIARSGTPLFLSIDPRARTAESDSDIRAAVRLALAGGAGGGGGDPLDWTATTTPRHWQFGDTEYAYDWDLPAGPWPLFD